MAVCPTCGTYVGDEPRMCKACAEDAAAGLLHLCAGGRKWMRSAQPMDDEGAWRIYPHHYSPAKGEVRERKGRI